MVVRDENGKVVNGAAKKVTVRSATEVEALAIKEGIELAVVNNYLKMVMETDSEVVYKEITRETGKLNWTIYPVIKDIQRTSLSFQGFECCWVNTKANEAADNRGGGCVLKTKFPNPFSHNINEKRCKKIKEIIQNETS